MKKPLFLAIFAALFSLLANETKTVSLADLPDAAQKTIKAQAGTEKPGSIEREDDDGDITYTIEFIRSGQNRSFTVDADGGLVSIEIALEDAPEPVRKAIQQQLGGGKLESIEKTFDDGAVAYDVDMMTASSVARSFTLTADGKLERIQIALEEIPEAVRKTIETHSSGGKLNDLYRVFDEGRLCYEANFVRDGRDRDFDVAPDGRIESERVFLSEMPPPARKTILEKIGGGKISRIDHIVEEQGVSPFAVKARKDGKPFHFSVGPRGRFLGMDQ